MVLSELLGRLAGRKAERQQTAAAKYERYVKGTAEGKEPEVAELETAIAESGKTADDFRRDVELLTRRRDLRATVARLQKRDFDAERMALDAEQAQNLEELQAAERRFIQKRDDISKRRDASNADKLELALAIDELAESCPNQTLVDAGRKLAAMRQEAVRRVSDLETKIHHSAADAMNPNWRLRHPSTVRVDPEIDKAELARIAVKDAALNADLEKAQRELAGIDQQIEANRKRQFAADSPQPTV